VKDLPTPPTLVESWPDWKKGIKELSPGLLMLLVHTAKTASRTLLEMGPPSGNPKEADYRLATDFLTSDYVVPPMKGAPIVLLLGCTTDKAKLDFETVASAFEISGAGIIVSTTNLIYGPSAVRLADMFLHRLVRVKDGESFGDVMLAVRREALADGMVMVLCISSYGDADWKLVHSVTPARA
jgi:hypothetical protein